MVVVKLYFLPEIDKNTNKVSNDLRVLMMSIWLLINQRNDQYSIFRYIDTVYTCEYLLWNITVYYGSLK